MAFCKNCGKEIKKGETCSCEKEVKFCKGCGKKLVGNEVCDCAKSKSKASGSFDFVGTMKEIKDDLIAVFKKPITVVEDNVKGLNMPKTYLSLAALIVSFGIFFIGLMKSIFGVIASFVDLPYFKYFVMGAIIYAVTILAYALVMLLIPSIFKNKKLNFKETLTLTVSSYIPMIWINVICGILGLIELKYVYLLILYLIPCVAVGYNFAYAYAKQTDVETNRFGYAIAVLFVIAGFITGVCSYCVTDLMGESGGNIIEIDEDDFDLDI